jgi:Protein of unknown function (DUF3800)
MRLLYCDESNLDKKDFDFFVYGGIAIHDTTALSLSSAIEKIRVDAGVPRGFVLKFNPGPLNFTHDQFIQVKQAVIEAAVAHGCVFLTSMILHNVATSPDEARRNEINRLCLHFQYYLKISGDFGLVLIDQFDDKKIDSHLREKFLIGATNCHTLHMRSGSRRFLASITPRLGRHTLAVWSILCWGRSGLRSMRSLGGRPGNSPRQQKCSE